MEEVINYLNDNQILFYVIGVSVILAAILLLAIESISKKTKEESEEKKKDVLETLENFKETETSKEEIKVTPVEVYEKETPTSEIDLLLTQMKEDLEESKTNPIESFEEFQEENAIISYAELKKATQKASIMSAEEEESQPIIMSVRELEKCSQKETEKPTTVPVKEEKGKFKNSEFISPIYGKMNTDALEYPKIPSFQKEKKIEENSLYKETIPTSSANTVELEEPLLLDELTEEMKRNEDFLQALKEFRKNL